MVRLREPMDDPMQLGRGVQVPLAEVELRTSRSSGPGGQHANVTASRVEAVFDVCASAALSEEHKRRISARLGPVVRATAQDTRSQTRNRELALERLRGRLASALVVQRPRRPTLVRPVPSASRSSRSRGLSVPRGSASSAARTSRNGNTIWPRATAAARRKRADAKRRRAAVKRERRRPDPDA